MKEKNNLKQIIDFRKAKLQDRRSANINPYPYSYKTTVDIKKPRTITKYNKELRRYEDVELSV